MCLLHFASLLTILSILLALPSKAYAETSGCTLIKTLRSQNVEICLQYGYVRVANRNVRMGTHAARIQLEHPSRKVFVYCGRYSGFYNWTDTKKDANQIRVSFLEGYLHMQAFWCEQFHGPTKAGIHCAVEAFSTACPGLIGDNHTCVYEVKTRAFSSETVRKAVQVKTELAAPVQRIAKISIGVSHTTEHTAVKTYSVNSRSYIVIPAGYRFCSFSEVYSEKDYMASTGFSWRCKLPKFVQTTTVSGRCTNKPLCKSKSPCQSSIPDGVLSGTKSTVAQPGPMLFILGTLLVALAI